MINSTDMSVATNYIFYIFYETLPKSHWIKRVNLKQRKLSILNTRHQAQKHSLDNKTDL